MSNYEKNLALRQGHGIASEDGYFEARPQIDSMDRRKVFGAGFERGWEAALAAEPAQERIQALELEVRQLTEQIAGLRHAPTPQADSQPAPVLDALPREDFAWLVVQEACETEPADEDAPECIRILRLDLKSAVLAAFLRHDAARAPADSVLEDAARYRWIRGPVEESTRYSRWRIEYWDGPNGWQPMQRERMDSAIDAARKQGANHDI